MSSCDRYVTVCLVFGHFADGIHGFPSLTRQNAHPFASTWPAPRSRLLSRFSRFLPLFGPPAAFAALILLGAMEPRLAQVLDLALPFFGLIGLGFVAGAAGRSPRRRPRLDERLHRLRGAAGAVLYPDLAHAVCGTRQWAVRGGHHGGDGFCLRPCLRRRVRTDAGRSRQFGHAGDRRRLFQYRLYGSRADACRLRPGLGRTDRADLCRRHGPAFLPAAIADGVGAPGSGLALAYGAGS